MSQKNILWLKRSDRDFQFHPEVVERFTASAERHPELSFIMLGVYWQGEATSAIALVTPKSGFVNLELNPLLPDDEEDFLMATAGNPPIHMFNYAVKVGQKGTWWEMLVGDGTDPVPGFYRQYTDDVGRFMESGGGYLMRVERSARALAYERNADRAIVGTSDLLAIAESMLPEDLRADFRALPGFSKDSAPGSLTIAEMYIRLAHALHTTPEFWCELDTVGYRFHREEILSAASWDGGVTDSFADKLRSVQWSTGA